MFIIERFIKNMNENYRIHTTKGVLESGNTSIVILSDMDESTYNLLKNLTYPKVSGYVVSGTMRVATTTNTKIFNETTDSKLYFVLDDYYATKINAIDHVLLNNTSYGSDIGMN